MMEYAKKCHRQTSHQLHVSRKWTTLPWKVLLL